MQICICFSSFFVPARSFLHSVEFDYEAPTERTWDSDAYVMCTDRDPEYRKVRAYDMQ